MSTRRKVINLAGQAIGIVACVHLLSGGVHKEIFSYVGFGVVLICFVVNVVCAVFWAATLFYDE